MVSQVPDHELELDVRAYFEAEGNKSEAARLRGLKRVTYLDRLTKAEQRLGVTLGKVVTGRIAQREMEERDLPPRGWVKRYVCTSIQNNTKLHPGFRELTALVDYWNNWSRGWECEMLVGTYSYNKARHGRKSVKRGTASATDFDPSEWYAAEVEPFIADRTIALAPGLAWCGEMNILPTNVNPLSRLEDYNGRMSNVVPHATHSMASVASLPDEATKFNYSTGTITQRNYIQKRAGILAEQRHSYGALVVEVTSEGDWWVRQLEVGGDGAIHDLEVRALEGRVDTGYWTEGVTHGDAHAAEQELWVRDATWGSLGLLDVLRPRHQFMHDVFSMRSRSPHEDRNFHRTYQKHVDGEDEVEGEVQVTADFLADADRPWCETVVIPSNHDRHLDRWLNEVDPRRDVVNAKFFHLMQYQVLDAMDRGHRDFSILEWALRRAGCPEGVRFLAQGDSFVICKDHDGGVECALHGDLGPNGARGSTKSLTKLARKINKGHDHTAAWDRGVCSAGACSLSFPYMMGPNSHSVTHIVTYVNGARALVTMWNGSQGKWRAEDGKEHDRRAGVEAGGGAEGNVGLPAANAGQPIQFDPGRADD